MTSLTLHIGMNKTGTTALQKSVFHNRAALLRAGVLYPKTGLGTRSAGAGLHFKLSHVFRTGSANGPDMVAALLEEIDGSGAENALISSEFFVELQDVSALARCLEGRDVRILVYLRRHDHWVSSLFSQAIKSQASPPWGPSAEAYIHHIRKNLSHYYRYSRLLDRWAGAFGHDAMDVRIYGAGARDIVKDVLSQFALDPETIAGFKPRKERINSAPSRRQLAAIDHVQRAPYPAPVKATLVRRILATDDCDRTRQLMTSDTARALLEEQAEDYADIARRYLGRGDGVLFDEPMPEPGGPDRIALWPGEGITVLSQLLSETV